MATDRGAGVAAGGGKQRRRRARRDTRGKRGYDGRGARGSAEAAPVASLSTPNGRAAESSAGAALGEIAAASAAMTEV